MYKNEFPSYCVTQAGCEELCSYCLNGTVCIECKPTAILSQGTCSITCNAGYKFYHSSPFCREICGDGLNLGEFECDDGNLIDGDGCDKYCKKEPNAICSNSSTNGSCYLPSYSIAFVEGMYKMNVKFNFPVENLNSYLGNMKATIFRADGSQVTVSVKSPNVINSSCIELSLDMDNVETSESDRISLDLPNYPKSETGESYLNSSSLLAQAVPNSLSVEAPTTKGLIYAAYSIGFIGLVCSFFTKEANPVMWEIMEMTQILSLAVIINFRKVPSYLYGLFRTCGTSMISFMPKYLQSLLELDNIYYNEQSKDNIAKHPFIRGPNFINNTIPVLSIGIVIALFYMTIRMLMRLSKFKANATLMSIRSKFEYGIFFKFLKFSELPIILAALYTIRESTTILSVQSATSYVSYSAAVLFFTLYIGWIMAYGIFVCKRKSYFTETQYKQKFGTLYDKYQIVGKPVLTSSIESFRKYLLACIVLFPSTSFLQNMTMIVSYLGMLLWYIIVRPQKTRIQFILTALSESLLLFGQVVYSLLQNTNIMVYHIEVVDYIACVFMVGGVYMTVIKAVLQTVNGLREHLKSNTSKIMVDAEIKGMRSINESAVTLKNETSFVNDKSITIDTKQVKSNRFRKVKL